MPPECKPDAFQLILSCVLEEWNFTQSLHLSVWLLPDYFQVDSPNIYVVTYIEINLNFKLGIFSCYEL